MLTGQQMTMHTANCLARMSGCTGQSDWVNHFVRFVTMLMSIYNDLSFKIIQNIFEFWTDRSRQIVWTPIKKLIIKIFTVCVRFLQLKWLLGFHRLLDLLK